MKSIIYTRNEDALRNGSFIHRRIGKKNSTYAQYMNGDFIGWLNDLPQELQQAHQIYNLRDAKKLIGRPR